MPERRIIETADHPYVALIPFDTNLAPLVASAELTRDYITADRLFQKYLAQTFEETDEGGHTHIVMPPDAKFWFDRKVKIAQVIAQLTVDAGIKEVDADVNLLKIVLSDKDLLTTDQRKEIAKRLMEQKINGSKPVISSVSEQPVSH